jgi:hypothetical protein
MPGNFNKHLDMKCVSAKFVPRLLMAEREEPRLSVAFDLLECAEADKIFFKDIVTLHLK